MMLRLPALATLALLAPAAAAAQAEAPSDPVVVHLSLKDHRFSPDHIEAPAGRRIRIELANEDAASEEFDSDDLHVEKDVTPHSRSSFVVGPLKPGTYGFMGELHPDTASGEIVAKPD